MTEALIALPPGSQGEEPHQIREHLNTPVDRAVAHAMKIGRHSVLVTQHSYSVYTIALSDEVPSGHIHERRLTDSVNAGAN